MAPGDVEHAEEPPRGDRLGLALQRRAARPVRPRRRRGPADASSSPDEDLAGRGVLLEPGGDVDGVAGDERLPRRRVARRRPRRCSRRCAPRA